jgi:hypothetical protein
MRSNEGSSNSTARCRQPPAEPLSCPGTASLRQLRSNAISPDVATAASAELQQPSPVQCEAYLVSPPSARASASRWRGHHPLLRGVEPGASGLLAVIYFPNIPFPARVVSPVASLPFKPQAGGHSGGFPSGEAHLRVPSTTPPPGSSRFVRQRCGPSDAVRNFSITELAAAPTAPHTLTPVQPRRTLFPDHCACACVRAFASKCRFSRPFPRGWLPRQECCARGSSREIPLRGPTRFPGSSRRVPPM